MIKRNEEEEAGVDTGMLDFLDLNSNKNTNCKKNFML